MPLFCRDQALPAVGETRYGNGGGAASVAPYVFKSPAPNVLTNFDYFEMTRSDGCKQVFLCTFARRSHRDGRRRRTCAPVHAMSMALAPPLDGGFR